MTFYNQQMVAQKHSVILTNWKREREAARAQISNADSGLIKSSDPAVLELFGLKNNGVHVSPNTAQRVSAVGACIGLIGGSVAGLPLHHYQKSDNGRDRVKNSAIWPLFNLSPIANWTAASMFEWFVRSNSLRGDAYAEIIRDRNGNVTALRPLHPDNVKVELKNDDLVYFITDPKGAKWYARYSDDVIHIPGNGFDGEKSLSVIAWDAKTAISNSLAADGLSVKFFENGGMPKHVFKAAGEMSEPQIELLRSLYTERYSGVNNAGKPMVLTEGLDVKEMSMSSVDAELLDSRKYSVIDIARAFRVPPVMIGAQDTSSSWGTGIEQMVLGFVKFTLQPYLTRIEQELNRKIIRNPEQFLEFELSGLLRGDSKAESEALRQARGGSQGPGWMTVDEIRRIKNLPPLGKDNGGDKIYEPKGASNEQKTTSAN